MEMEQRNQQHFIEAEKSGIENEKQALQNERTKIENQKRYL